MLTALFNLTASLKLNTRRTTNNVGRMFNASNKVGVRVNIVVFIAVLTVVSIVHNVSNNIGLLDGMGVLITITLLLFVVIVNFSSMVDTFPLALVNCTRGVVPLDGPRNHRSRA